MQVAAEETVITSGESRHGSGRMVHRDAYTNAEKEISGEVFWGSDSGDSFKVPSSEGSSVALQQAAATSSLVFQYFSLLASYHGAVHVPRYWAQLLLPSPVGPSENENSDTARLEEDWAEVIISPATEIDLSACYVGPTTLLALADLLRVHCVTVQRSRIQQRFVSGRKSPVALSSAMVLFQNGGVLRARKEDEVMCSLLPHLETLRLSRLSIDFTSPFDSTTLKGGSAVLRHMLEALQGHPSIRLLDISGNPVAAAMVPAISRLVQTTPSLTTLVLDDTLISESEKEMLRAQCLLNELRLQQGTTDSVVAAACDSASSTASPDSAARTMWTRQMRQRVLMAVERGISDVPWLLGRSTALIRSCDVSLGSQANMPAIGTRAKGSRAGLDSCRLSESYCSSGNTITATDAELGRKLGYVNYDSTAQGWAAATATVPLPAGPTWSAECVDVVRCAFMPRLLAQRTVLGGRQVWPNVPEPLEVLKLNDLTPPSAAAVAATDLMRCLRQVVLPEPEAPPGLRLDSAVDGAFLTTSEVHYRAICRKQETQWGYVLQKVSEHLVPVFVRNGETLYAEGSECDSIYLLPISLQETHTYAELQAGVNPRRVNQVLPGQWVGDAEVLDCVSVYAQYQSSPADHSSALPVCARAFQRSSTVRMVTEATGDVVVWALPFSVAFFYLYAPSQLLHKQFIHRTPMNAFAHIHPVHLACVPVHQHARHSSSQAWARRSDEPTPALCGYAYMSRHVLLLEEGEFLLRLPTRITRAGACNDGRAAVSTAVVMEDHHLLSGVTVLTQPLLDLDAALRAVAAEGSAVKNGVSATQARGPRGMVALGKDAALSRFRALKTAITVTSTTVAHNAAGEAAAEVRDEGSGGESSGYAAELLPYRTGRPGARWRYAAMANEEFTALCPELRVALTRHCCVVPDL
ncbi:hypothetical protein LSCM1_03411 [Leishmania martiniquensis]|uniref:Uncharacterized protein n=1 Tax=Leishmania martiniquensis TaxID=1580590 RepID=A0A836KRA1_9TRYP|nr:hypothetical protein LSCM1_03411 [Leishmania martiniquensis]